MSHAFKWSAVLAGTILLALSLFFAPSASAAPAQIVSPSHAAVAQSCYSNYQHFTASFALFQQRTTASRSFHTTSRCSDINVQFLALPYPTYVTPYTCSGQLLSTPKLVRPADGWRLIASSVRDGTCFTLTLQRTQGQLPDTIAGFVAA